MVKGNGFSCTLVIFVVNSAAHSGLSELSTLSRGYATLTPACGLASPSGLLFIFTNQ